ncbi:uncharacterized protein [Haliotis asinina]|uniref:uncharacterized protein n=1 Tax=Haliotis asinina TaxID=109174 RepID=UPI0035320F15
MRREIFDSVVLWMFISWLILGVESETPSSASVETYPTSPPHTQVLHVPHLNKTVTLDIIHSSKVLVVFHEDEEDCPRLSFRLQTYSNEDHVMFSHTVTTLEDHINIKLHFGRSTGSQEAGQYWPVMLSAVCVVIVAIVALTLWWYYKKHGTYRYRVREPTEANTDPDGQTPVRTHQVLRRIAPLQLQSAGDKAHLIDSSSSCAGHASVTHSPVPSTQEHPNSMTQGAATQDQEPTNNEVSPRPSGDRQALHVAASSAPSSLQAVWDTLPFIDEAEGEDASGHHDDLVHQPVFTSCISCTTTSTTLGQRSLPVYLLLTLSILTVLCVCSFIPPCQKSVLNVDVPSSTLIRHVRMYSDQPELSNFFINSSTLSLVSRLQILDYENCHNDLASCMTFALCEAAEGFVTCRCKRGYFVSGQKCQACSTSCPAGHYMTGACSASRDVDCKKCSVCRGSTYEAAPCTMTQDTICVEVAFPVGILPMNYTQLQDDGTLINVTASSNVFMERLRDMEELETPMYVTNNQQSMDYVWRRTSGLKIKIGISDVYLVPEYVDIDHVDDNAYFHMNKNISSTLKEKFQETENNYCRDPMPDFYSLYLHIFRHRITAAKSVTCSSKDHSIRCPPGYKDGQPHLRRYINLPCHKYEINRRQNLTELRNTHNSVVCPDNTPLSLIFGMPNPAKEAMRFPSEDCKFNQEECQKCLQRDSCIKSGNATSVPECCNIECYKMPTCNQAFSSSCPLAGVECAKGEVYMFTLSPVFEKMYKRYMCHVRYKKPTILYNINYQVRIPSLNYHIEQRNFTITVDNLLSHRQMSTNLDFLNVQHNTWFDLEDEMIVIANHADIVKEMGELSLHPLKSPADFASRPHSSKKDFGTQMYTYIQFDVPFRYSSVTWMNGGCEKNLSRVHPNQTLYKSNSVRVAAKILKEKEEIHYQMYRTDRSPLIRLFVNKSQSVLSSFQSQLTDSVLVPSALQTAITWSPHQQAWSINITGSLTGYPGVIGVQIFDKMMTRCIGYFDVLVTNRPQFFVQFNVSSSQPELPDIFMVLLNDSVTSHRVVLSSMVLPQPISMATLDLQQDGQSLADPSISSIWLPVIVTVTLSLVTVFIVFVVYVFVHLRTRHSAEELVKTESVLLNNADAVKVPDKIYSTSSSKAVASRTIVFAFILLYITYSIVFTFSVAFGIIYFSHLTALSNFTRVSNLTEKLHQEVSLSINDLKAFEKTEISYLKKLFRQRKDACMEHLNKENADVLSEQVSLLNSQLQVIYVQNGSLQYLSDNVAQVNAERHIEKLQMFIKECNSSVQKHFRLLTEKYYSELEEVSRNGWLDFPRDMFLGQTKSGEDGTPMSASHLEKFMAWLQMDKADALLQVQETLANRLESLVPSFQALVATNINLVQANSVPSIHVSNRSLQAYKFVVMKRTEESPDKGPTADGINRNTTSSVDTIDIKLNYMLYISIALFLLMDIFLWVFRLAWLYTQVQEANQGCEELIPQDEAARKVLETKTGQNPPRQFDALEHPYVLSHNDNVNQDNELNVYFCQSYPRSKEDILRDIWAQKLATKPKTSREKLEDIWMVQDILSCMCWLHRVCMSKLLWRFLYTAAVIIFVCCIMYIVDSWLCADNFQSLVGSDLLISELEWQAQTVNSHVSTVADVMNSILQELKVSVDHDVETTNMLLFHTWETQMSVLMSMLSNLCSSSNALSCNLTFLQTPHQHLLSSCNFLPLKVNTYTDLDIQRLKTLVITELSPLLEMSRHLVFMTAYIVIVLLCARIVCQVTARTVKDYLIVSGHLPRARIYQFSNTMTGMSDDPHDQEKEIHRSASWLESCESGVYVGDNDDSARESTI